MQVPAAFDGGHARGLQWIATGDSGTGDLLEKVGGETGGRNYDRYRPKYQRRNLTG
jgi:hypothetical protein